MERPETDRVLNLLEEERKRLAREIHDGPAQSLTNISMRLDIIRHLIESSQGNIAIAEIERLQNYLRASLNDMRQLIFDLRPTFLENGLTEAIRRYAQRFAQSTGLEITVEALWGEPELPKSCEVAVFRICQEALNNTFKHAQATKVQILLESRTDVYQMVVQDNGRGFELGSRSMVSFGLQGMHERMSLVGGSLKVESAPGEGTVITCEVIKHNG